MVFSALGILHYLLIPLFLLIVFLFVTYLAVSRKEQIQIEEQEKEKRKSTEETIGELKTEPEDEYERETDHLKSDYAEQNHLQEQKEIEQQRKEDDYKRKIVRESKMEMHQESPSIYDREEGSQILDRLFRTTQDQISSLEKNKSALKPKDLVTVENLIRILASLREMLYRSAIDSYCTTMKKFHNNGELTPQKFMIKQPLIAKWDSRSKRNDPITDKTFEQFKDDLKSFDQTNPHFWRDEDSYTKFETKVWQFFVNYHNRTEEFERKLLILKKHIEQGELQRKIEEKEAELRKSNEYQQLIDNNFSTISPHEFEETIAQLFEKMGYSVRLTSRTVDFGVDVVAKKEDDVIAIQAKKYRRGNNVGNRDIQRLLGAMQHRKVRANKSILATSSDFTVQAVEQAKETPIELWNGKYLAKMIEKYLILPETKVELTGVKQEIEVNDTVKCIELNQSTRDSTITFKIIATNSRFDEARGQFDESRISRSSPLGRAMIGRTKGETIKVETPAGTREFKITEVLKSNKERGRT